MPTIRPYRPADKSRMQELCVLTSNPENVYHEDFRFYLTTVYNDYYTEHEPESCFVLADDDDVPVGYVICAKNVKEWRRIFLKEYMPKLKANQDGFTLFEPRMEILLHSLFARRYPAHLHIDILKEYCGQGYGVELMNTLFDHLRENGVPGVQLLVDAENKRAVKFYLKMGFKILAGHPLGSAMGYRLSK
ncbi:MAG: GNAT family N-acetyltransferase [Clostridia bacterium]|nr:GNAT family N-acetyltransferase [Clostridia bacterium]